MNRLRSACDIINLLTIGLGDHIFRTNMTNPHHLDDLLVTKLEVPLIGPRIVSRRRLTDLLKTGMEQQLTLITAPAGYGKTTLLADWMSAHLLPDWRVIWVTVDAFDNEPFRLWDYIAAGVKKVYPRLRFDPKQLLRMPLDEKSRFSALIPLLNAITKIPYQLALVLDDYQWITSDSVHEEVRYLLDHQPKNLHLLISSRVTPPFPLSRLRAQRQLVEITARDLSFNLQEANNYFSGVMEMAIDPEQVASLLAATEGWIAGLQLVTLSLQGRPDQASFIASLPEKSPLIFEYLTEEVLDGQEPEIKDFLLKTSILSEFCAPLCDAILGCDNSADMLKQAQKANLFIVSRDERQQWYSYHRLFSDTLQKYLHAGQSQIIPELHNRACTWLRENGYPDKAVSHALATGDFEQAARILDDCAMQAVIGFDLVQLVQWISRFSDDLITRRPQLGIYYALAHFLLERFDKIEPGLRSLEQLLDRSVEKGLPVENENLIRWEIAALRASLELLRDPSPKAIGSITGLIQNHPPNDVYFYGFMTHCLAEAYALRGDLEAAVGAYTRGCNFAVENGLIKEYCYSLSELAYVRKIQGRLEDAARDYQNMLDYALRAGLPADVLGFARTGLAEIAVNRGRLGDAGEHIQWVIENLDRIETSPLSWIRQEWLHIRMAMYYLALNDTRSALLFFDRAMTGYRANRQVVHYLSAQLIDLQVKVWAALGELNEKALGIQEQLAFLDPLEKAHPARQAALARCYMAQGDHTRAAAILSKLIPLLRTAGMNERLIEALVIQSTIFSASGNLQQALQPLRQALQLAAAEGHHQVFIDEGAAMKTLLNEYSRQMAGADTGAVAGLVASLTAALRSQEAPPAPAVLETQPATELVYPIFEPLSPRELEILNLITAGRSTKEIAAGLKLSINTAKVHIKSIYRKTGVHTRRALIARARELGLVKSS